MTVPKWVKAAEARLAALPRANTPHIRSVARWLAKSLHAEAPEFVVGVALALLAKGYRLVAYELVRRHEPALRSLQIEQVEAFGADMDSWHAVDIFCICIAGPCWREGQISDQDIERMALHASPWWRRAALVATTGLNVRKRGGYGDSDRTLVVARLLAGDREDTVIKALSWALRELVSWEPDRVEAFLKEYRHVLAPRVRREVRNKLETGVKNPPAASSNHKTDSNSSSSG